uniref:Small ribosomal subunit protein mS23 n=1 Tax=Nothoprocta perdicaria TaxID=30464 RepID=A0A8C6ZJY5_NOTPE
MAGNRAHKIGSVFSRTRNLLRVGVVPRPLWFDVYGAFPPLREPVFRTPRPRYGRLTDVVPPILYPEDSVRAKFYSVYGSGPRPFDLSQPNFKSTCQRFVEKFNELKEEGRIEEDRLFEETGKALLARGIILQRKGVAPPARQDAGGRDAVLHTQLQTVLEEMQERKQGTGEQPAEPPAGQEEDPSSR